ncbi:MAG: MiaB/RimO family radical SAM methylthiotransferase [Candidatus Omnitrophica bacterium]|nr:MiaB/RimO family radical SAM methylthiotransferase [Candidatus Omnitrophota bacterium]
MSKVNSRKDPSGRMDTDEDVSAKHLPQSVSDLPVKSGHRSLRGQVDENPCGIVLNAPRTRHPKVFIKTFGCQMNARDSELVAGMLIKKGYRLGESAEEADIVLFNTCSVRQKAEDKVWSEIGKIKTYCQFQNYKLQITNDKLKDKNKKQKISNSSPVIYHSNQTHNKKTIVGLIGCMAENYQKEAFKKSPLIDIVVGPNNIGSITNVLDDFLITRKRQVAVGRKQRREGVYNTEFISGKNHANVIIMEGCNNFCSYCIVPYVRGRERSRSADAIIEEIKGLVQKGIKEITLLGQNVNSYTAHSSGLRAHGRNKLAFTDLLKIVNEIEGLESFDFVTSHPKDANTKLFKTMAELPKCGKFLHLPVQSGSDRILKLMNRGYTRKHYIKLAKQAKEIIPKLRLTTDGMVGFPSETEKDFEDTFDLMKQVEFSAAYIFKYSSRPHTKAMQMPDDVLLEVKKERNRVLLNFQKQLHKRKNRG